MKLTWSRWRRDLVAGLIGAIITSVVFGVVFLVSSKIEQDREYISKTRADNLKRQLAEARRHPQVDEAAP
jgi:hypothetical protein